MRTWLPLVADAPLRSMPRRPNPEALEPPHTPTEAEWRDLGRPLDAFDVTPGGLTVRPAYPTYHRA